MAMVHQPLCKFQTPYDHPVATFAAGSSIPVEFMAGGASHGGGHCQFSVSYDGGANFVVLHSEMNHCFGNGLQFNVPIPHNAPPSDRVVFSWSWVNAIGNREFYQNCADIAITGGDPNGAITGPRMVVANYGPDTPQIPEFFYSGDSKNKLYEDAPVITVRPSGSPSYQAPPQSLSTSANTISPDPSYQKGVNGNDNSDVGDEDHNEGQSQSKVKVARHRSKPAPPPSFMAIPNSEPATVCNGGDMKCADVGYWMQCAYGQWVRLQIPPGTTCKTVGNIVQFT
ncbi:hypothetical protein IWQ60_007173 [Tieghemiomyces parasiticus]|uniref:Chitin-binding type-4 domain-containing protein n=1 Tax=Tieghemiomyces parasiticus TaxID=78921 RepID=A0A9W8A028_9FUNG|nr:hypothetical protein IWQ60_007173 [Tieghemiomyces parasiticus]